MVSGAASAASKRTGRANSQAGDGQGALPAGPNPPAGQANPALGQIREEEREEVQSADRTPRLQIIPPGMDPVIYQQIFSTAMQAAQQMMQTRESDMLAMMRNRETDLLTMFQAAITETRGPHNSHPRLPPLEQGLLRSLTEMPVFTGEGTRTWDDFQKEFVNRAAMISALPKTEWVRYIHSRIAGRALDHAQAGERPLQDANGVLRTNDFDEYCAAMRDAMFGAAKTPTALLHELCAVRQEGKFADPDAFLREKERILKKIPHGSLAGWSQAALVIMGMDPLIVTAISPNPHAKDGQYHSYEELRKAVVATVGLNQLMLPNHTNKPDRNVWQKQGQQQSNGKGQSSPRYTPYTKGNNNKQQFQQGKSHTNKPTDGAGPASPKQVIGKWSDTICTDCGHPGHKSKGFKDCPKHVPNAQFQQKDDKGKGKA